MLLGTISIVDAAVARWPLAFVPPRTWGYYALTDLFIVAAITYDHGVAQTPVGGVCVWGGLLVVSASSRSLSVLPRCGMPLPAASLARILAGKSPHGRRTGTPGPD